MPLETQIKNTLNDSMKDYIESETYKKQVENINNQGQELRFQLNEQQQQQLDTLIEDIKNFTNSFTSEAYLVGVIKGIALTEKFSHTL
ncbi:hypothetical protein [Anaerotignum sp.]|uniref:hypothetical protein n=1 Tax=Anaerotignum sp. TaxID=2039241 RepID=UPI00332DA370